MSRLSRRRTGAASCALALAVLSAACAGSDENGHAAIDPKDDAASVPEGGTDGGSHADASTFSGEVKCSAVPCVTALSAKGGSHVCALLSDRTIRCWGSNSSGELGAETPVAASDAGDDGGTGGAYSAKPVRVDGVDAATEISVSGSGKTSCARIEGGAVMCWGSNAHAQLALDAERIVADVDAHPHASQVRGLPPVDRVDLGGAFACAVGDAMYCWGDNSVLQLGRGYLPAENGGVGRVALRFRSVVSGAGTTRVAFALRDNGLLLSWGGSTWQPESSFGMPIERDALGRETSFSPDGEPFEIPGLQGVTSVSAGDRHACALAAGIAYCWGQNGTGAVGSGSKVDIFAPYLVTVRRAGALRTISASNRTTCVSDDEGSAYCWGDNSSGQLGAGNADFTLSPARVEGLSRRVVQLAAMDLATCALLEDGSVQCWGSNAEGQLGIGARDDLPHHVPRAVIF